MWKISVEVGKITPIILFSVLVNNEILPGIDINKVQFWNSTADLFNEFIPRNKSLLAFRQTLQSKIDAWYNNKDKQPFNQLFNK